MEPSNNNPLSGTLLAHKPCRKILMRHWASISWVVPVILVQWMIPELCMTGRLRLYRLLIKFRVLLLPLIMTLATYAQR